MYRVMVAWSLLMIALSAVLLAGCGGAEPEAATITPELVAGASDTPVPPEPAETVPQKTDTPDVPDTPPPPPTRGQEPAVATATAGPTATVAPAASVTPGPAVTSTVEPTSAVTAAPGVTASPAATATRPTAWPTSAPGGPQVLSFVVEPAVAENVGDRLRISWQAVGEKALLCPMQHGPVESRCEPVALKGSREFVTNEESLTYAGFGLKVTAGDQFVWGTQNVSFLCRNLRPWFFADPPARCPAAEPVETYAAGQYFERGLMIWRQDTDLFYVMCEGDIATHDQRLYEVSPASLASDASPDHRVGEDPPAGLYEPVSGFGMVWRGELQYPERDLSECLGWATEPEAGFSLVEQCETTVVRGIWACYVRGPHGEILRLSSVTTAGFPLIWQVYE